MSNIPKPPKGYDTWVDFCVITTGYTAEYIKAESGYDKDIPWHPYVFAKSELDKLRSEVNGLNGFIREYEEEQAAICPEDVSWGEYITMLKTENERLTQDRRRAMDRADNLQKKLTLLRCSVEREESGDAGVS